VKWTELALDCVQRKTSALVVVLNVMVLLPERDREILFGSMVTYTF